MRRLSLTIMLLWLVVAWVTISLSSQPLKVYEDFVETPEYRQALALVSSSGKRTLGVRAFLDLADAHPGTTLGAKCLFEAATWGEDASQLDPLLARIVREYPRSRFEMHARSWQLSRQVTSLESYFDGVSQLASSFGAPTLEEIKANPTRAVRKVRALPREFRDGMAQVYADAREMQLMSVKNRLPEALATTQFGMDAYFDKGSAYRTFGARDRYIIAQMNGGWQAYEGVYDDPRVKVLSPKPGQRTGARPQLRLAIDCGDFYHVGIDLHKSGTTFKLDGQDIFPLLDVRNRFFPVRQKGKSFQKYRIAYRPAQPLPPGLHTFEVVVLRPFYQGQGPGRTALRWNFTVRRDDDDHEDDRHYEKWDRAECDWGERSDEDD